MSRSGTPETGRVELVQHGTGKAAAVARPRQRPVFLPVTARVEQVHLKAPPQRRQRCVGVNARLPAGQHTEAGPVRTASRSRDSAHQAPLWLKSAQVSAGYRGDTRSVCTSAPMRSRPACRV